MSQENHSAASDHLPPFITAPGETDYLMAVMAIVLIAAVLLVGVLYFRLHALPEHIAHRSHKLQLEIVAVLGLLALFTQEHLLWIAGLLLALIEFPDFGGMLGRIARSLEKMAGIRSLEETSAATDEGATPAPRREEPPVDLEPIETPTGEAAGEAATVAELRHRSTRS
jgi:hypothetical protein